MIICVGVLFVSENRRNFAQYQYRHILNYLSAENIAKSYGANWLFRNLTVGLSRGDKVALIGTNGTGKTSLLNILAGTIKTDEGLVSTRKDIRTAYLDQNPQFDEKLPVIEVLFGTTNPSALAVKMYEKAILKDDSDLLSEALEQMDNLQAWDFESKVKQILGRLGIHDVDAPIGQLSGGQRKRVALAQVLIEEPDLLIMDEPTNHLDLDTIEWLEEFLNTANQTLLIVTHDRYFLDKVCNIVMELDRGTLYTYKGNYAYYLEKKAERQAIDVAETDKAKNQLRKELEWMRRQPKARSTKAQYRIDAFYDLKERAGSVRRDDKLDLNVKSDRLGSKIIELESVSKKFGDKVLIHNFLYTFKKNDRIGIVGKNGMGKSTLLNMMAGLIRPDTGKVVKGDTIKIGYYTQSELEFKDDQRVLDIVKDIAEVVKLGSGQTITASAFLTLFLFPPSKQHDLVSKLSGGEKRRLQLLKVLIQSPNFLILDEPTNDLDVTSLNVLEEFLLNFDGILVLVSHDRYFMDRLVDHLFVFEGEGKIRDFPGNYTDYREVASDELLALSGQKADQKVKKNEPAKVVSTPEAPKRKLNFKEQREYTSLETDIDAHETRRSDLIERLNAGSADHAEVAAWAKEINQLDVIIAQKSDRWLELAEFV